jgi:uncharacterized protein (DUF4213/DUF364 family)
MNFAQHYLAALAPFAAGLPPVKALHLPPLSAADGKNGEFCALELADGAIGLAYVLLDDTLRQLTDGQGSFGLEGMDAMALARAYGEGSGVLRTLGFAAANAITRHLLDRAGYRAPDSGDSIGGLDPGPGDRVGMIGFFRPLAARIVDRGAQLTVIELKAELAGAQAGFTITTDATRLRECNKVLSTSTLLLNGTLDRMSALWAGAGRVAMIGPSAGCLPDPLFARGVTLLGGTWIEDGPAFVEALRAGEGWSAHARKSAITPADYPGWAALRARM